MRIYHIPNIADNRTGCHERNDALIDFPSYVVHKLSKQKCQKRKTHKGISTFCAVICTVVDHRLLSFGDCRSAVGNLLSESSESLYTGHTEIVSENIYLFKCVIVTKLNNPYIQWYLKLALHFL